MASIFSKIVAGEIPAYKVAENNEFLAFLDVFPLVKGHVLVIPKVEIDYIFDLDTDVYLRLMAFAKIVATGIEKAVACKRIGIAVVGLEVPHVHIHLVPITEIDDLNFSRPKLKLSEEEFKELAKNISEKVDTA